MQLIDTDILYCRLIIFYRHTILSIDNLLYVHGGFMPNFPNKSLDSFLLVDLGNLANIHYTPKII